MRKSERASARLRGCEREGKSKRVRERVRARERG